MLLPTPPQLALLGGLLTAAVLEEVIFRLGLQRWLIERGVGASNAWTAAGFALAHGLARSWALAAGTLPAALLLGWIYQRQRRLWPCIAGHAALNAGWWCWWLSNRA